MFTIIGLMLTGMLLGYLLRKRDLKKIHPNHHPAHLAAAVYPRHRGRKQRSKSSRGSIPSVYEAVILTLGGTLGSVIAAWALWRALYKRKGGRA